MRRKLRGSAHCLCAPLLLALPAASAAAANVTMASDGRTMVANIMSFIESNFLGRWGFEVKAGV